MAENPLLKVSELGQAIWLDNLTRNMIHGGRLKRYMTEDGVTGVTSNPAIFNNAMTKGADYDEHIRRSAEQGLTGVALFEALAIVDIQDACDLFRKVYEDSNGTDGFVSFEVSPHLANDTQGTVSEARRLWKAVNRPNVMIKIPGTPEGVPAVETCLAEGINVNITLLFSLDAYQAVMDAHLAALETRQAKGLPLATVASVASFFLSRIDSKVDARLDALRAAGEHAEEAAALRGKTAVASARLAYQMWKETYSGERWETLAQAGGRVQKPLWASTSTKDEAYSDVKYVESLIGPQTVNTVPDQTLDAFRDHGRAAVTVEDDLPEQRQVLERLAAVGISLDEVTDELVAEGIKKFVEPFDALIQALEEKREAVASGQV